MSTPTKVAIIIEDRTVPESGLSLLFNVVPERDFPEDPRDATPAERTASAIIATLQSRAMAALANGEDGTVSVRPAKREWFGNPDHPANDPNVVFGPSNDE